MDIISDTNIFLAVALDEPEKEKIINLTSNCHATAPNILPYELGNALVAMTKRKQITNQEAVSTYQVASKISVRLVSVDIQKALEIALRFNIYAYDAYFLQTAKAFSCPLITLDKRMKQVAKELGIQLLE